MRLTPRGAVALGVVVFLGLVATIHGYLTLCGLVIVWAGL